MTKFQDFLNEELKNPEVKKEYDALAPEYEIIQALIDERKKSGITQKQLSERTGIAQGDISKLENGNANPSLKTLYRLAQGLGKKLTIHFEPLHNQIVKDQQLNR
jgi:transcriptional regulator with XRE-family HTH domain